MSAGDDLLGIWDELVRDHPSLLARPFVPVPVVGADPAGLSLLELSGQIHAALAWAGLGEHQFELVDVREPFVANWRIAHPRLELVEVDDRRLVFQVEHMGAEDVVLAAVCHEIARAFVAITGAGGPYRGGDRLATWSDADELRAGVAGVLIGFGAPLLAWGRGFRSVGEIVGRSSVTRSVHFAIGPLEERELARLVSRRLAARGRDPVEVAAVLGQLVGTPADLLRSALEVEPPVATPVRGVPFEPPPLSAAQRRALEEAEEHARVPHRGAPAHRYFEHRVVTDGVIGFIAGILPAIAIGVNDSLGFLLAPAGGAVGALIGTRRALYYCSLCWQHTSRTRPTCAQCGATLGVPVPLAHRDAHRAAEEAADDDDPLTRAALGAPTEDE